jgi:hypothetical protein
MSSSACKPNSVKTRLQAFCDNFDTCTSYNDYIESNILKCVERGLPIEREWADYHVHLHVDLFAPGLKRHLPSAIEEKQ